MLARRRAVSPFVQCQLYGYKLPLLERMTLALDEVGNAPQQSMNYLLLLLLLAERLRSQSPLEGLRSRRVEC